MVRKKKNKLLTFNNILFVILLIILLGVMTWKGCIPNNLWPDDDNGGDDDGYQGGNYNPPDVDVPSPTPSEDQDDGTPCESIILSGYGDFGVVCEQGVCETNLYYILTDTSDRNCAHYWDYTNKIHKCGCTETFFCGQYCFEYLYTNGCECPPNSERQIVTRSTFQCVPDGYYCEGNTPIEEMGPFPE